MAEYKSGFGAASASAAYAGTTPAAPTPPAVAAVALPGGAPTLGLNLGTVTIIIAGDVNLETSFSNAVVQRR